MTAKKKKGTVHPASQIYPEVFPKWHSHSKRQKKKNTIEDNPVLEPPFNKPTLEQPLVLQYNTTLPHSTCNGTLSSEQRL